VAPLAGSTPVRRTIVDEALAYLERLEGESGADDVTLRLELAAAYRQIGGILGGAQTANLGDRDGAIRQYERARAILLPLATETAHYDVINALSQVDNPLSTLYSLKDDQGHSLALAREGVDHTTRYLERNPGDRRGLEMLAAATFQLAWTMPRTERDPVWRRTLQYYERLLAEVPDQPRYQRNVALVEKYLGSLLSVEEAAPHFKRAVELDEKRLATAPDDRVAQFDTAISLAGSADIFWIQGDTAEAARLLERSLAIRQRLADTDPGNVQAKERLGYVLAHLARVQRDRGAWSTAKPRAQEAVRVLQAVFDVTKDRSTQDNLAYAWLVVGEVEQSAGDRGAACRAFQRSQQLFDALALVSYPDRKAEAARKAAACR
ncbi:MAG: tetratricopeptide repeat protein, partial [Vicinamibacterales bacterium]